MSENLEAEILLQEFNFFHSQILENYPNSEDLGTVINILEMNVKLTLIKYQAPLEIFKESFYGLVGWAYSAKPFLLPFILKVEEKMKPLVLQWQAVQFKKSKQKGEN